MRIDIPSALTLKAVIEADLGSVRRIAQALEELGAVPLSEPATIAAGYHLHNLYNALENTFDQVSRTFENHIKDQARWHRELLQKMFLDLSPLRPPVLLAPCKPLLDELRGFRHRFRHSYDYPLEPARVEALRQRWLAEGTAVIEALSRFAQALGEAAADLGPAGPGP